ncbi:MAG: rRNA pseudouridine synthase [Eggerthellaceae bacterium]|nr:rRNA pseudouridine synthase [Eggerthellaceae bacterium]
MRLQKFLREAGVASRRRSEDLMTAGRVKVNGEVVTTLGSKVDPLVDVVEVDGTRVSWGSAPVYLMLNKPMGYITTMSDPQGRPCVAQLVPQGDFPGLYPVGRLDNMTHGLLLFTTDGSVGHGLLHPSHHVHKTYLARVEGSPTLHSIERLRAGVVLDDGPTAPAQVDQIDVDGESTLLRIAIHEGRTRQVRRMCASIGHECIDLERISFGPLSLGDLALGAWRMLTEKEACSIRLAAGKSMLE